MRKNKPSTLTLFSIELVIYLVYNLVTPVETHAFKPFVQDLQLYLPQQKLLSPWKYSSATTTYNKQSLYEYINGAADLYLEYGFQRLLTRELIHDNSDILIELYEMRDPISAWGLYANFANVKRESVPSIPFSYVTPYSTVVVRSRFYVMLKTSQVSPQTSKMMTRLAELIYSNLPDDQVNLENLFQCFPKLRIQPESRQIVFGPLAMNKIHYLSSKNLFKLSMDTPALFAKYKLDNTLCSVFLIKYNNSAKKQSIVKQLEKYYATELKTIKTQNTSMLQVTQDTYFFIHQTQRCLIITLGISLSNKYLQTIVDIFKQSPCCKN